MILNKKAFVDIVTMQSQFQAHIYLKQSVASRVSGGSDPLSYDHSLSTGWPPGFELRRS